MKNDRKTEIKVGITVVIGIIVLFWIISWAKNIGIYSDNIFLKIKFDSVAGLEIGAPVLINGVKKGRVKNIKLDGDSVLVTTEFASKVKLNSDATFSIMMLDLMGGKKIEITPGISSTKLNFSKIQKGKFKGDVSSAVAALSSVQGNLIGIIKKIEISLTAFNKIISDKNFVRELKNSVRQINVLSTNLNRLVLENKGKLSEFIRNGNNLVKTSNQILSNNKTDIRSTIKNIRKISVSSQNLILRINSILKETKAKRNNVGKLLYDKNLISNFRNSLIQLNELTKILIKQLKSEGINVNTKLDIF